MGNCVRAGQKSVEKNEKGEISKSSGTSCINEDPVVKVLVEVKQLSLDEESLCWQPALESLVPLAVHSTKVGDGVCVYRLEATGVDGRSFCTNIKSPGTKLCKSSENFIQWKDEEKGGTWGLNFMTEQDTDNFLKIFSSSNPVTEDLPQHDQSSLPSKLPLVSNDTAAETESEISTSNSPRLLPTTAATDHDEIDTSHPSNGTLSKVHLNDQELLAPLPTSPSGEFSSVKSEGGLSTTDSEELELYQPTSPFKIKEEFILPDILEESEEVEIDTTLQPDDLSEHSSLKDGDLDIMETTFGEENLADEIHGSVSTTKSVQEESQLTSGTDLPMLPKSPPPGPLLSPQSKFIDDILYSNQPPLATTYNPHTEKTFRHSIAGALEDLPPPLPTSPPPGKMMSPRQSLFLDLGNISSEVQLRVGPRRDDINVSQLATKIKITEINGNQKNKAKRSKTIIRDELEKDKDEVLSLVPPIQDDPNGEGLVEDSSPLLKRLGSYHMKTFEPPKEFSDSGFNTDRDIGIEQNSMHKPVSKNAAVSLEPIRMSGREDQPNSMFYIQKNDSSTYTSDDQLTENSGSVGLKTLVSSGSEISGHRDDNSDNDISSITTKVGGNTTRTRVQNEPEKQPSSISPPPSITRKTGWIEVKTILVCKNRKVGMKSKRKWRKYWANLKGSALLLYGCDGEEATLPELGGAHSELKLESCLAHAVHDHVKRDHLFCLSTSNGRTYYMQTTSQAEVEDWIMCIHCAAAVASTEQDKDHSLPILMGRVEELNKTIEKENQLKNLTSLNLGAVSDTVSKSMASEKLTECSENLEAYRVELYRIRCYIASLQGTELPNPQSLLGSISKPTKNILGGIGIFTVGSLHAIVNARQSLHSSASSTSLHFSRISRLKDIKVGALPKSSSNQPHRKRKGSLDISGPYPKLSSIAWGTNLKPNTKTSSLPPGLKGSVSLRSFEISQPYPKFSPGNSARTRKSSLENEKAVHSSPDRTPVRKKHQNRSIDISGPYPISPKQVSSLALPKMYTLVHSSDQEEQTDEEGRMESVSGVWPANLLNVVHIRIPGDEKDSKVIQFTLRNDMTAGELLPSICEKFKLEPSDHYVSCKLLTTEGLKYFILKDTDVIMEQQNAEIEICRKSLKMINLVTKKDETTFGLTLVPEWDAKTEIDLQTVNVEDVKTGSSAETAGIRKGDELMLVNDTSVMELGWVEVEKLMSGQEVNLMLRTCLLNGASVHHHHHHHSNRIIDSLICPAPPSHQPEISQELIKNLTVPTPSINGSSIKDDGSGSTSLSQDKIDVLLKDSNEVSRLLRLWQSQQTDESTNTPWTREDKLRKSISDLIETETDYVMRLNTLVERYLEPLRHEDYLSVHEVNSLTGNIVNIVQVQNTFLANLKEAWNSGDATDTETPLQHVVFGVIKVFLEHMGHFKQYSSFCASHQIVKQIITAGDSEPLIEFFRVRNPTFDPSLNIDSLLAKPIVRISRYPLFLGAMLDHTTKDSEESHRLKKVIKEMGVVADHMNEMQRLCETYWSLIHSLANDAKLYEIGVSARIVELEYHGEVAWLNPSIEGLSKSWKKGQGPTVMIFIFKSALIVIYSERKQKRKDNRELRVEVEDAKYRQILPTVKCRVSNLPDSDGVTNMWHLQYRSGASPDQIKNYFFRSKSASDKSVATELIQASIQEQQRLYGSSPSISCIKGQTSPSKSPSPSPTPHQLNLRTTSPTLSTLLATQNPVSSTDHD